MLKHREKIGKLIGALGWGIGWAISWGLILVYQQSVDIRPLGYYPPDQGGFQSPSYSVWTLNILVMVALGWLIGGLSTGGMLRLSNPSFKAKHFVSVVLLSGILGLILGLLQSQLYAFGELVMADGESIYYLYVLCLLPFLILAGYGLIGYLGSLQMERMLNKITSKPDNQSNKKNRRKLAFGSVLGAFAGLTTSFICFWILSEYFDIYYPPLTPLHTASVCFAGFVGGIIVGSIINGVIGKYFLQPK